MKNILTVLSLCLVSISANAQKVYEVSSEAFADVKVYEVSSEAFADLCVYNVSSSAFVGNNDGKWFWESAEAFAGWKNNAKKHLME